MSMTSLRVYPNGTGSSSPPPLVARVVVVKRRVDRVLTLSVAPLLPRRVILAAVGALIAIIVVVIVIVIVIVVVVVVVVPGFAKRERRTVTKRILKEQVCQGWNPSVRKRANHNERARVTVRPSLVVGCSRAWMREEDGIAATTPTKGRDETDRRRIRQSWMGSR